ncbi:MAG TPA: hypothetical protein VM285_12035 [Polyangia bacterium]|nr:hypothetical protein [Polyangia bacterium]
MSVSSGRFPSAGFVALCATLAAAAAFFAWGLRTPPLERVWTIHHELKIGRMDRLAQGDRRLLEEQLALHAGLGPDLLDGAWFGLISAHRDGWIAGARATLLRTAKSAGVRALELDVQAPDEALPIAITVRGTSWSKRLDVKEHGPVSVELPPPGGGTEIVEVEIGEPRQGGAAARPSVRISWRDGP